MSWLAQGQLQQKLKSHANAKDRLQKLTLAFEDVKRWGKRFHDSMRPIVEEECALDSAQEVVRRPGPRGVHREPYQG